MSHIPFQRGSIAPDDSQDAQARLVMLRTELAAATDAATRMRLLGQIGETLYLLGDSVTAIPLLREAVAIAQGTSDARQQAAQRLCNMRMSMLPLRSSFGVGWSSLLRQPKDTAIFIYNTWGNA